jgi:hypothetical protein
MSPKLSALVPVLRPDRHRAGIRTAAYYSLIERLKAQAATRYAVQL